MAPEKAFDPITIIIDSNWAGWVGQRWWEGWFYIYIWLEREKSNMCVWSVTPDQRTPTTKHLVWFFFFFYFIYILFLFFFLSPWISIWKIGLDQNIHICVNKFHPLVNVTIIQNIVSLNHEIYLYKKIFFLSFNHELKWKIKNYLFFYLSSPLFIFIYSIFNYKYSI